MTASERALRLILRLMGSSSLLALIFVAAPQSRKVSIHSTLGMGALPDAPVVGYLAGFWVAVAVNLESK